MSKLFYPDLDPAPGWPGFRAGTQMRLIPPDTPPQQAEAAIIVSPLLARSNVLPGPAKLIEQTLAAELQGGEIELVDKSGPVVFEATSGLEGLFFEVRLRGRTGVEQRIYLLLVDELCYYGINFLASEAVFHTYEEAFWTMAKTIRPFKGKIAAPDGGAFGHYGE